MDHIAILTGGDSAEHDISLLSANTVLTHLNPLLFKGYIIHLKDNKFIAFCNKEEILVNKKDFSFIYKNKKIRIDKVFMALHGPPAEDGSIQSYFDKLNIPYSSSNSIVSKLTFNKYNCNTRLTELGFRCAVSFLYKEGDKINEKDILDIVKIPCFVKPNSAGSSFGVSKVAKEKDLITAIKNALLYDNKVIVEQFIKGTEVSCGVFFNGKNIKALPITEIISENDFFDYQAKYEGKSKEITPARLKNSTTLEIQETTKDIYKKMKLNGICRIDYIIMHNLPYVIEINTIPGLSENSIIPQQLKSAKLTLEEIFETCLLTTK